jgi:hypothetical protein
VTLVISILAHSSTGFLFARWYTRHRPASAAVENP